MDASNGIDSAPGRSGRGTLTTARMVGLTAAVCLVVGGLVLGPMIASHQVAAVDPSGQAPEHTITVSGSGLVSIAPDVADVVLGVTVQKPTAKEARSAAATAMQAVVGSIKKNGVADKDIATSNVSLNPVYEYSGNSTPRLNGYQFGNTVKVTVHDLDKVAAIVDDAVAAGATNVQGISFRLEDPKQAQQQARALAMTDARAKADALAQSAGVSIKGVATITETSYTPVRYDSYALGAVAKPAADVATPIQTGTTDVQVQVTVAYLIG